MPRKKLLPDRLTLFGSRAAAHPDVDELLGVACREVADAVNVSHVKALEYVPEEKQLLVRAGVGWRDGVVGSTRIPAGLESAAGFTLQTGKPTISNDLRTEERFHIPELLRAHGVKCAANVLIKNQDFVFGVLEADSVEERRFNQTDVEVLQGFANILALVIVQTKLARENALLSQKLDLLYRELSHRTKNNNQILISMINLQKSKAKMLEVSQALDDVINRIYILNSIDDFLTLVDDTEKIDVPSYIAAVAGKVFSTMSDSSSRIRLVTDLADGVLLRDQAQAIAIVVNEFIVNSFKYAFDGSGVLSVRMTFDDASAILELSDDGPGKSPDAVPGLGTRIIEAVTKQLDGVAEWPAGKGTRLRLTFPSVQRIGDT